MSGLIVGQPTAVYGLILVLWCQRDQRYELLMKLGMLFSFGFCTYKYIHTCTHMRIWVCKYDYVCVCVCVWGAERKWEEGKVIGPTKYTKSSFHLTVYWDKLCAELLLAGHGKKASLSFLMTHLSMKFGMMAAPWD